MALQTVQVSVEPRLSTATHKAETALQLAQWCCSPAVSARLRHHVSRCLCTSRRDACERISAIQAVLKGRTVAIRKGNKHQLGLFFSLEACQRNGTGWSAAGSPANANFPSSFFNYSTCCSSAQAPSSLHALEHSTGSERIDAFGRRAVEVIICMITRDFSVISMTSQASLSLSLSTSHKSHSRTIYRKRFRASYNKSRNLIDVRKV